MTMTPDLTFTRDEILQAVADGSGWQDLLSLVGPDGELTADAQANKHGDYLMTYLVSKILRDTTPTGNGWGDIQEIRKDLRFTIRQLQDVHNQLPILLDQKQSGGE